MKNIKFKITFGIILIFLFALIEYKYINETTRYEISNLTRWLWIYLYRLL